MAYLAEGFSPLGARGLKIGVTGVTRVTFFNISLINIYFL